MPYLYEFSCYNMKPKRKKADPNGSISTTGVPLKFLSSREEDRVDYIAVKIIAHDLNTATERVKAMIDREVYRLTGIDELSDKWHTTDASLY